MSNYHNYTVCYLVRETIVLCFGGVGDNCNTFYYIARLIEIYYTYFSYHRTTTKEKLCNM